MKTFRISGSRLVLLACLTGFLSFTAPNARADEDKDPPTRVARISAIDGSVSMQPGGEGDWGTAAKNRPMTIGDKLWVDKDSRAELQTGEVTIHLGTMTALSFLNLDENVTQMRLAEGSLNFRVRELREGDLCEIDTPNMAFIVRQAGAFRIDVSEDGGSARVTVIRGEGEVTADGKTYPVHAGERAEFQGTDNIQYNVERAPGPDGLDHWAESRDLKEDNSISGKYVSPQTPGYSDLDDYGTWSEQPDYGHVWYPNDVGPDWAPYSDGYWNSVGPWGWTWIGAEPWGFAPYHYGRWNYFGGRWGWCPGPYFGQPIYGPAFVGFFGGGFGVGVGWFPLGFGEPFYPWFRCGGGFRERINVRNTFISNRNVFNTNVRNFNYVNAHNARAVTVANRNTFVNGQSINRGAMHVTDASLRGARVTNSVGLRPTQHSSLGSANFNSRVATPSAAIQNRAVVARTAPAQGASRSPVRTFNSSGLTAGRVGNSMGNRPTNQPANGGLNRPGSGANTGGTATRQRELSQSRPPSATSNNASQRAGSGGRTWEAQGSATDRGRAPAGFGSSNRPANTPAQTARMNEANRPPWVRGSATGSESGRLSTPNSNNGRSYNPPARSYNQPSRTYNPPARSYSPPANGSYSPPRGNSAPGRSYSAPSRTYNPPARSYSPQANGSYSAPRSNSAPSRNYSAPPSRSYSAPSRGYSAPSHSSGGGGSSSRGGGGGGGSHSSSGGGSRGGGSGSHH